MPQRSVLSCKGSLHLRRLAKHSWREHGQMCSPTKGRKSYHSSQPHPWCVFHISWVTECSPHPESPKDVIARNALCLSPQNKYCGILSHHKTNIVEYYQYYQMPSIEDCMAVLPWQTYSDMKTVIWVDHCTVTLNMYIYIYIYILPSYRVFCHYIEISTNKMIREKALILEMLTIAITI